MSARRKVADHARYLRQDRQGSWLKEGQHVNAGDVLFEIDPVAVPARGRPGPRRPLEQAHTTYDNLVANIKIYSQMLDLAQQGVDLKQRRTSDRKTTLVKSNFGSQLDLDNAAKRAGHRGAPRRSSSSSRSPAPKTQLLGKPDLPLEQFPALCAGQGRSGAGRAQSRPYRDAARRCRASRPRSTRSSSAAS